uniref:Armadillo repeat containing 10 n=1 Tax=Propithecus coquereli TaxID=379532 RepID=A0A2K6FG57_PROCO
MGGAREVGWVAAGLVLGAGACYCIYRLTRGRRRGGSRLKLCSSRSAEDLTNGSYDEVLNAEQLQKLLYLLESTEDPVIIERALVTVGNNAAFSVNQVQVLKLLLNLSENPAMTEGLLSAQVDSSFLSLYDGHVAKEILLRVLTLFQNINNCLKMEGRLAVQPTFTNGSLFFLLYGEECAQKIRVLVHHHDAEVKEKVVTIIPTI